MQNKKEEYKCKKCGLAYETKKDALWCARDDKANSYNPFATLDKGLDKMGW
jgi:hypothetical protein